MCDRSHHDLRKEHPREQRKVYWSRCSSGNDLGSGDGFQGQVSHGIHLGNESATILEFFAGLHGTLLVTFEEGTWAAWLYDLLKPHVAKLVVCNPRKNALLKHGNKSDRIDARKLADLLRLNDLEPVYHGETGVRMLRELARGYLTIVKDLSRVMNRLKALYRSWAIPCAGGDVYYTRHRSEWLGKIPEAGTRRRAEQLYQQLDMLQHLRQRVWSPMPACRRHYPGRFDGTYSLVLFPSTSAFPNITVGRLLH